LAGVDWHRVVLDEAQNINLNRAVEPLSRRVREADGVHTL
jgi:hypothetical protein